MSKSTMGWMVVAAMTFGGAGLGLGAMLVGGHDASSAAPVASTVMPRAVEPHVPTSTLTTTTRPAPSPTVTAPAPRVVAPSPSVASTGELRVRRMQVTSGVEGREPIDHPSAFDDSSERIYAFVDVANSSDEPRELLVTFENGQRSTGHVTLEIPAHSARFRTWAWTSLSRSPGEWTALVRDEDGAVLATDEFEVR